MGSMLRQYNKKGAVVNGLLVYVVRKFKEVGKEMLRNLISINIPIFHTCYISVYQGYLSRPFKLIKEKPKIVKQNSTSL